MKAYSEIEYLTKSIKEAHYKPGYDFIGQSYNTLYPNLHKYPATMLPQVGLELLKEFKVKKTNMLDPYCGSGSSFISGLEYGMKNFIGFDLNPLAVMITMAKLTYIDLNILLEIKDKILDDLYSDSAEQYIYSHNPILNITNCDFWINHEAQKQLLHIYGVINNINNNSRYRAIYNLLLLAFSETLREVSYTRNNEFKLFRMKNYEIYKPDVLASFIGKLDAIYDKYISFYYPKLFDTDIHYKIYNNIFHESLCFPDKFDCILTSPPYGDSKTTVAYGQFSTFINEWMGMKNARKLDSMLMGGKKAQKLYSNGIMKKYIEEINSIDEKRALEISGFYFDLEKSIASLINFINIGGKVFFIVGNRRVKDIELPTDLFIAEKFTSYGFRHLETIKRKISNKVMPLKNSPTNKSGVLSDTMNYEYIVVCELSVP